MASTIINDGAFYPASTTIVLRANSAGNPIWHNQVDGNFENLRLGHNQVVTELATKSIIGHVHSVVTTSVNGFMSSADKAKLDGVASGANNYALPTATSSTKGGVKVGSNLNISNDAINVPGSTPTTYGVVKYDDSTIKINGSNQLYAVDNHSGRTDNPHGVTASQVGLGSVVSDIAGIQSDIGSDSTNTGVTIWENLLTVENKGNANLQEIQALQSSQTDTTSQVNNLGISMCPVGTVMAYAGPSNVRRGGDQPFPYWTVCDGRELSRTSFNLLFDVIGTDYGDGDGSTTFNVPNLKGRVIAGTKGALVSGWAYGDTMGQEDVTLNENQIPSHDHVWYGENDDANASGGGAGYGGKRSNVGVRNPQNVPYGKPTYVTPTGGGQAHTNMQPTMAMYYIIHTGLFSV